MDLRTWVVLLVAVSGCGADGSGSNVGTDAGMDWTGNLGDAGMSGIEVDSGTTDEDGIDDADSDVGDSDFIASLKRKLRECGIVSQGGKWNLHDPHPVYDIDEYCHLGCITMSIGCDDARSYCGGTDTSPEYNQCLVECAGLFACADGQESILSFLACDGFYDCTDESDEEDCQSAAPVCEDEAFCDGVEDCNDGLDEWDCSTGFFRCANGDELPANYECDLEPDCSDGSDEHEGCVRLLCE